ncbi:hypothetical protein AVEN_191682-1 [Araneus ventricosus]|uniref:Uncharacterized protein n=1 Tax=Araneus ventricosus TaxID=182803 RepID=A0A4Y2S3V3_ARAVE|nr:hypothetical protein AVEN_191682-1 [Araneus ventricosus]
MTTVLEECTLEEQRSVALFWWEKELQAKDISKLILQPGRNRPVQTDGPLQSNPTQHSGARRHLSTSGTGSRLIQVKTQLNITLQSRCHKHQNLHHPKDLKRAGQSEYPTEGFFSIHFTIYNAK